MDKGATELSAQQASGTTLNLPTRVFLYGVVATAAAALLAASALPAGSTESSAALFVLVGLLVLTRNFRVASGMRRKFDCVPLAQFALVVMLPMREAVGAIALGEVLGQGTMLLRGKGHSRSSLFNGAVAVLAALAAESVALLVPGESLLEQGLAGLALYLTTSVLVAGIITLQQRIPFGEAWWDRRAVHAPLDAALMAVGLVVGVVAPRELWVPVVLVPFPVIVLLTVRRAVTADAEIALRDDFIRQAAHEFRTPMTTLYGYVQLLSRRADPSNARMLRQVEQQCVQLRRLVDRMLDLSLLRSGELVLATEPVGVKAFAEELVERMQVLSPDEHLRVVGDEVHVAVDPVRLDQVLTNLVVNALRYGCSEVDIEVGYTDDGLPMLAVRDYGMGVPAELRERIFGRYVRGRAEGAGGGGGLGLGLYISREIVRAHGGSLAIETPEDGGARFVVTLPKSALILPRGRDVSEQPARAQSLATAGMR